MSLVVKSATESAGNSTVNNPQPIKSLNGRSYQKVETTGWESVRNALLIIFTLGIYLAAQNYRFKTALINGDLEKSAKAIQWGAYPTGCMNPKDIQKLIDAGQTESLKFVDVQMNYDRLIAFHRSYDQEIRFPCFDNYEIRRLEGVRDLLGSVPAIKEERETVKKAVKVDYLRHELVSGGDFRRYKSRVFQDDRPPAEEQVSPHLNIIMPTKQKAAHA